MVETGFRDGVAREAERAVLIGAILPQRETQREGVLDELARLADTAGATIVGELTQKLHRPHASAFYGKGKAEELGELARANDADLVISNEDLSPGQLRNLEKHVGLRVVDRTELILDIFAMHARTHQSRLQVQLAQLQYLMPRLKRMWTHLSREGGTGQGGGIGTRGPGEKQIEIDRRILRKRLTELRRELGTIAARRQRMASSRDAFFTISLVGYTNAGKSTLLRQLTGADAYVADQLFATLETQTRAWMVPTGKRVFLSDTVGFVRDLPHHLVASFHATLEEVMRADLILHVVDAAHADALGQVRAVEDTLARIGAEETPRLLVLNKIDQVEDAISLNALSRGREPACRLSALHGGTGIAGLATNVERFIAAQQVETAFEVPAGAGRFLAYLEERGTVLDRRYVDGSVNVRVLLSPADRARALRMAAQEVADS
ncbi:MAG: GTPase HflX [Planctomycetota bacterium]